MELKNQQILKPLVLLAVLKQLEYQATNRLLLAALEKDTDSGTTQKDAKKTPPKMLPSTLNIVCVLPYSLEITPPSIISPPYFLLKYAAEVYLSLI